MTTTTYDPTRVSRPVIIVPYQAGWPEEFRVMGTRLRAALGSLALRIDHIGSTSVPHLSAKDVIDIQVTVAQLPSEQVLAALQEQGFRPRSEVAYDSFIGIEGIESDELAKHYAREPEGERRIHIHIRKQGNLNQRYALLFRDYLRTFPIMRCAYEAIKIRLAKIFPESIDGYLYIKDPVMDIIYDAAELWAAKVAWQPDNEYL